MKRQFHDGEDDGYLYNRPRRVRDHPLSLVESSTTLPKLMYDEALYRDEQRRIYRPRVELTEAENKRATNEEISEAIVCLDCYLLPSLTDRRVEHLTKGISREKRREQVERRKTAVEKGDKPEVGDKIKFGLYKPLNARDKVTVREWEGKVIQVNWGVIVRWVNDEEVSELNMNCGFLKVQVLGTYDRSLVMNPAIMVERSKDYVPA